MQHTNIISIYHHDTFHRSIHPIPQLVNNHQCMTKKVSFTWQMLQLMMIQTPSTWATIMGQLYLPNHHTITTTASYSSSSHHRWSVAVGGISWDYGKWIHPIEIRAISYLRVKMMM